MLARNHSALLFGAMAIAGLARSAPAAIIFTQSNENNLAPTGTPNSVAPNFTLDNTNNLLNGRPASLTAGNFALEGSGGLPRLTDGVVPANLTRPQSGNPTGFNYTDFATAGDAGGSGSTVTYTLAAPSTITSIQTYGGWQDEGRDQQSYTVQYSFNGADFVTLNTVNFNPSITTGRPNATRVTLTSTGDPLHNVRALRFNFNTTENGYSGYDEFAAYGTVPEPASLGLLGLSTIGLLARRRRR